MALPPPPRYLPYMDAHASEVELERVRRELGDRYAVVRCVGRGGMGAVYLARELSLDRLVALKVLPASGDDETTRERFRREARMVARLSHPGIVPLYAYGETDSMLFYAMAYVDGESLAQRLKRDGPLSGPETRELLSSVAAALDHAHRRGLVHRDIKPSNILVDGESGRILVTDFGIGRALGAVDGPASDGFGGDPTDASRGQGLTRAGQTLGTPAYMAPEQATGSPVDARTDLYALGLTAYEAAAGRPPFEGGTAEALLARKLTGDFEPLATWRPDVDPRVATLVDRCLATDPDGRPDTAERVLALLADDAPPSLPGLEAGTGSGARRGSMWMRGRWWMGLVALGALYSAVWARDAFKGSPIEEVPSEAVMLYSRALVHADRGQVEEARALLREVVATYPGFEDARERLGQLSDVGLSDADVPLLTARLREAVFAGSLDEAQGLIDDVMAAADVSRPRKIQMLRTAARDFVRSDAPDRARRMVDRMLELEPPLVMLHPAVEPPELMEIYGSARRARGGAAAAPLDPDSIVLSIGAFVVTGLDESARGGLAEGIPGVLMTELGRAVRIVDRSGDWFLAYEPGGSETDAPSGASAGGESAAEEVDRFYERYEAAMAGRLGAVTVETHVLHGSVAVRGDRVLIGLWVVSVETVAVVGFAQAEGAWPDGLFDAGVLASGDLLEGLGVG